MMNMQLQKLKVQSVLLPGTLSLLALQFFTCGIAVPTAQASDTIAQINSVEFTPPPPPPNRDAPGHRGGGAGRGCGVGKQTITALVPRYQQPLSQGGTITKVWGTTIAERPTFWFDIPYEKGAIMFLEFVLQDNSANDIYRAAISPPNTPGVINLRLPETVPALETGKLYQWFFVARLQCNSNQPATRSQITKEQVTGWVQRISPDAKLATQLNQADPQQRIALYAKNGIWFDALTSLAELRLANPQDARSIQDWDTLLQAVELDKVMKNPLISCCQPKL